MAIENIIEARAVEKTYAGGTGNPVHALRGLDLAVRRGELISIMGASGCGKTTLLNCLSGLDGIDSGEIIIDGIPLNSMSDNERTDYRASNMGFVFQLYNLLPVLSSVENVELPMLIGGTSASSARKKAMEALDMVGLIERATHRPGELSGGQRQRVTIARALVNEPSIVWADEPTGDLDSETAHEIMDLILEMNAEKNQTFVIVTHAIDVAERTDGIVSMRDGIIVEDTRPRLGSEKVESTR
jgi:ABC-type lipoprotein export system ATPase subunit